MKISDKSDLVQNVITPISYQQINKLFWEDDRLDTFSEGIFTLSHYYY